MRRGKREVDRLYFLCGYSHLLIYIRDHADLIIEDDYRFSDGFELGLWMYHIRRAWRDNELAGKYVRKLKEIGITMDETKQPWESMYFLAREYYKKNKNINLSTTYRTDDGLLLGAWVDRQRRYFSCMDSEQTEKLLKIGIGV